MPHTLYVVGTPLGNATDWSQRARETLASVPVIAAEDTRVTLRLLAHCDINRPRLLAYTDAFAPKKAQRQADVLAALAAGDVALVSDAGMPGIADPGTELVQAALAAGHRVVPIPGPSAVTTALSVSGLPAERFLFLGFLPRQRSERLQLLRQTADEPGTLVCFETPHRLLESLADLASVLGNRRMMLARELTKEHEEIWYGSLNEALAPVEVQPPRGEYVIVVAGAPPAPSGAEDAIWPAAQVREALALLAQEGIENQIAARLAARLSGWRKKDVYRLQVESRESPPADL